MLSHFLITFYTLHLNIFKLLNHWQYLCELLGLYSHSRSGWLWTKSPQHLHGCSPGAGSNIRRVVHRTSVSAGIVQPSSHWNKYFWSHIFLEEQTELLSWAVSLYSHTKAALNCPPGQPISSQLQWLCDHAVAGEHQIPAALPRVSGPKEFSKPSPLCQLSI